MALVKCPECGKAVSDKAASCPNCGYPLIQSTIRSPVYPEVITKSKKDVGVSILLTIFLGPLGVFYSSVGGGFFWTIATVIIGVLTFGVGVALMWVLSIVAGVVYTQRYNSDLEAGGDEEVDVNYEVLQEPEVSEQSKSEDPSILDKYAWVLVVLAVFLSVFVLGLLMYYE
jgi:uncharacterized OB-fold protein